jgi:hypothetical protein
LLLSLEPPAWHLRHSRAVAEAAAWLARRAVSAGRSVDRHLVESAALLHDIDKLDKLKASTGGLPHADGSAAWLASAGYPELAPVVIGHPVTRLADATWFAEWLAAASPEALIVSYADKRAGQQLEPMSDRFASWRRRYPPGTEPERPGGAWSVETMAAMIGRAEILEARVCELADIVPADLRRLRWTGPALAAARGGDSAARGGDSGRA